MWVDINKAKRLLPTTSGFFFGGVEYDEWYLKDIKDTKEFLKKILKNKKYKMNIRQVGNERRI